METNCTNGTCNGNTTFKLYNDVDEKTAIKDIYSQEDNDNYRITDETKNQFTKYTFTYKKDSNNNYYFSKIEKN